MNITWNLQIESGASNPSFNSRMIFQAFARIERYWNVRFVQVSRSPMLRFVLTRQRRDPSWSAWTSGRSIYIPSTYRFANDYVTTAVLVHEIGHAFGSVQHAPPGNVMGAMIVDPFLQFTEYDSRFWFKFQWRSGLRPWQEPNKWRPMRVGDVVESPMQDVHFGCDVNPVSQWWSDLWCHRKRCEVAE
jgi:hypothetical protein